MLELDLSSSIPISFAPLSKLEVLNVERSTVSFVSSEIAFRIIVYFLVIYFYFEKSFVTKEPTPCNIFIL